MRRFRRYQRMRRSLGLIGIRSSDFGVLGFKAFGLWGLRGSGLTCPKRARSQNSSPVQQTYITKGTEGCFPLKPRIEKAANIMDSEWFSSSLRTPGHLHPLSAPRGATTTTVAKLSSKPYILKFKAQRTRCVGNLCMQDQEQWL